MKIRVLILVAAALLGGAFCLEAQVPNYVPTNGLVGWWPFNGNANDESGSGNHLVNFGATLTNDRFGNCNMAYNFLPNQYLFKSTPNTNGLNFTWSFWMKKNNSTIQSHTIQEANYGSTSGGGFDCYQNIPQFICQGITTNATNSNAHVTNNVWYHFVVTKNNSTFSIFINGVLSSSGNSNYLGYNQTTWFKIGAGTIDAVSDIDDIGMWNRVLNQSEIFNLYTGNAPFVLNPTPLAAIQGPSIVPVGSTITLTNTTANGTWSSSAPSIATVDANGVVTGVAMGTATINYTVNTICGPQTVSKQINVTSACLPAYVPTNGLVGWWPFCGNANDESGNGNHGTVNGAMLASDRDGVANRAYSFDGVDDFIRVEDSPILDLTNNYSVSFWVNIPDYSPFNAADPLWAAISHPRQSGWATGFEIGVLDGNNNNSFYHTVSLFNPLPNFNTISSNNALNLNTWNNIIVTYNGSQSRLYQNGILENTTTLSYQLANFNTPWFFGKAFEGLGWTRAMKGLLDDIAIYNRALTPQEISDLYTAGCNLSATISPASLDLTPGGNAVFNATAGAGASVQWQTNPSDVGWQNVPNGGAYSGAQSNTLTVSNVQLANHLQPFRVIATVGTCADTSEVAVIQIHDTCTITVNDTVSVSVTDTLYLAAPLGGAGNTVRVFPNATFDHLTIDYGNFALLNGYTLQITNALGQAVFSTPIAQQSSYLDLYAWGGNGTYTLSVLDPQQQQVASRVIVLQ